MLENTDFNDPSWTGEGPDWYDDRTPEALMRFRMTDNPMSMYEFRGGDMKQFRAGQHMQNMMIDSGVQQAIDREIAGDVKPGGNLRKLAFEQYAREALAAAGYETRKTETRNTETETDTEMTIDGLISDIELELRNQKRKALDIRTFADDEGRKLTREERREVADIDERIEQIKGKLEKARAIKDEEDREEERLLETHATPAAAKRAKPYDQVIRIGSEPKTYRSLSEVRRNPDGTPAEPTFISDLFRAQILGDPTANERLGRHGQEMIVDSPTLVERAVATGGVPGFLPPQYLTELFAEYARAGRPTANLCRRLTLPADGMTVNIPRITTATSTAVQATENATVANQDPAATLLTANVNTIAGYVVLSRQSVERGPMTEEVVVADLAADYSAKLDAQVLNGTGANGQHLGILGVSGINAVTYTAASPVLVGATAPMWPKLASAVGQVMSGRYAGPTAMVMSPTEWAWMLAAVDASTYRPVIQPVEVGGNSAMNQVGTMPGTPGYNGVAGYLFNLPVFLDGNMPANLGGGTNETRIIVADFEDLYLWEDNSGAPAQLLRAAER